MSRLLMVLGSLLMLAGCQARQENVPIIMAVVLNNVGEVQAYLREGGDPNLLSRDGDPLVYLASGPRGGPDVMTVLLTGGGDANARSASGRTALQNAASWCDTNMIAVLLAAGADIGMIGADGKRPIDSVCAAPEGRREATLKVLLAAGA